VLEAMLCERPVIATAVGCVPDLIDDRVTGLVVDGGPDAVAAAARLLTAHPAWARGLAVEARVRAEGHGFARTMARRYEDLIESLWRQKTGAPGGAPARPGM
jgi:glycosyltransferase involved in cell wall biosynthesis